jgi:hypothetical protein
MEQFTKKKKIEIYSLAAEGIFRGASNYSCVALKAAIRKQLKNEFWASNLQLEYLMKEFFLFKPDNTGEAWWNHDEKEARIFALLLSAEICKD